MRIQDKAASKSANSSNNNLSLIATDSVAGMSWKNKKFFILSFGFLALMVVGLVGMGAWFWYGNLEESVPGAGQIVPAGKLRRVMSPISGIVAKVNVEENQVVKKGQILFELDPESTSIEKTGVEEQLALLQDEANALQAAANGENLSGIRSNSVETGWVAASRQAYQAQTMQAEMQITEAKHRYQEAQARVKQAQDVLTTSEDLLTKYQKLLAEGGISEKDVYEYQQRVDQQRGEVAALSEALLAAKEEIDQSQQKPQEVRGNYYRDILARLSDHEQNITRLRTEVEKDKFNMRHQYIVSPIDGTVNEQSVRGAGDVVQAGQSMLSLVPNDAPIEAEVRVTNKDLAYIHLKQRAALRMDAFPYQHFGRLYGTIEAISPSTQQGGQVNQADDHNRTGEGSGTPREDSKPYYVLTIKPDRSVMISKEHPDQKFPLKSGMTLSADIITREKNILSFFTEPMHIQIDRAFRDPTNR